MASRRLFLLNYIRKIIIFDNIDITLICLPQTQEGSYEKVLLSVHYVSIISHLMNMLKKTKA